MKATPEEIEVAVRTLGCGLVKHFPADENAREIIMLELVRVSVSKSRLDALVDHYLHTDGEWRSMADMLARLDVWCSDPQIPTQADTLRMLEGQKQIAAPDDPEADAKFKADMIALEQKIKLQNAQRRARPVREVDVKTPGYLQ